MVTPELLTFVKQQLAAGIEKDALKATLAQGGWSPADVDEALAISNSAPIPTSPTTQTSTTNSVSTTASMMVSPHHARRWLATLVVVLVLICIGGAGAYAYFVYLAPNVSPRALFDKSLEAGMNVKSFSYAATTTAQVEGSGGINGSLTIAAAGAIDRHDTSNLLSALTLQMLGQASTATSSGSVRISLETRTIAKKLYLELQDFTLTATSTDPKALGVELFVALANGIAKPLEGQWIEADLSTTSTSTAMLAYTAPKVSAQDLQALRDYFTGESYIQSVQNVGSENISGVSTYHLRVAIQNTQALVDLIQKINQEQDMNKGVTHSTVQVQDYADTILQPVTLDEWVGVSDSRVYKMTTSPIALHDTQDGWATTLTIEASFANYGQPVSVEAPAGAKTLQALMQQLFGGLIKPKTPASK